MLYNMAMHCNIEFEITESYLVGKTIHPSFPDDRSRWKEALKIPIKSHYYFEQQKDAHGRDTNEWIENSSRSHWSARPMMKLDLASIHVLDFGGQEFGSGWKTTSVQDIEWDKQSNFLGFTLNMVYEGMRGAVTNLQGGFRVNFLKFDHDRTFKKIPYHQENARFMNILHVMGRRVEGIEPELYAARWDLRKPTTLYLNGVPPEHQKTVISAVEKWNTTLREIGAIAKNQTAFVPVVKDLKHPFDLRYPAFNWISDRRISLSSPLGVGMAHSDVRNGKILWGGVVLYGGLLENYVNRYAPVDAASASGMFIEGLSPFRAFTSMIPQSLPPIPGVDQIRSVDRPNLLTNLANDQSALLRAEVDRLSKSQSVEDQRKAQTLREQMERMPQQDSGLNEIVANLIKAAGEENYNVSEYFKRNSILELLGQELQTEEGSPPEMEATLREQEPEKRKARLQGLNNQTSPFFIEHERTVEAMVGAWMNSEAQRTRNYPQLLESVVMDLSLHEIGHFLGLGHQFKENIVPAEGTVPSIFVKSLATLATAERGFTNYSSVMGYRSGHVELATPADQLHPGPHDSLVLRYLYLGKYSTYDAANDKWKFEDIPVSGKIPTVTAGRPTSYFPACNDFEASMEADPFCNRWDRGSKAEDIAASYFQNLSDNLLSRLYSLVGGGGSHWLHEYYLWNAAFSTFSRVRLFYDEMRRRLRSEPRLQSIWDEVRNDKDSLFEFSQACRTNDPTAEGQVKSEILRRLFKHKDIVDLCRANELALREFKFFLNLPDADYSRIDHTNRYISAGFLAGDVMTSFGHVMGSWFQLSNFPLKFASMFTLTTAEPYQFWGYSLAPNFFYRHQENKFLYRTLYPREYTRLISDSVQNNMRFAATGMDSTTTLGRTILATSSLVPYQQWRSNDSARLPREFNDMLDQQTKFQIGLVAVVVKAVTPDANSGTKADHFKKFTGNVFDFFTGKEVPASEVYLLPKGDLIVSAPGMFLYPVTKLKFYKESNNAEGSMPPEAYVLAYKLSFDYEDGDELVQDSVKNALLEKHNNIMRICLEGFNSNGLANFFETAQPEFEGFYIPPGISREVGKEKTGLFYESIEKAFVKYDQQANANIPRSFPLRTMRRVCDEAMRGIGQISAAAALLNGHWLNITPDYLEK